MRKFLTLAAVAAIAAAASAQDGGKQTYLAYAELLGYQKGLLSQKVTITVDFGQKNSSNAHKSKLVGEDGKDIVFNSMIDAMAYMSKRGWSFVQAYAASVPMQGNVYHYLMSKEVASDDEITEGFTIRADYQSDGGAYSFKYMRRRRASPAWSVEGEERRDGLTQEEAAGIAAEWRARSDEDYEYECQLKRAK